MSLERDGVWAGGLWASTVWANGVWYERAITPDCYNYIASKINDSATVMTGPIGEFTLLASKIDEFEATSGKITEFTVMKGGLCCGSTH